MSSKVIDFLADDGLAAPQPRRSHKPTKRPRADDGDDDVGASSSARGKAKASGANDDGDGDDDDEHFIASATIKANKRAGTQVAKQAMKAKTGKAKSKVAGTGASGGGSFQSMGLHPSLLRALLLRGYSVPTPIQRQAIPSILEQPPRDLVGMARTGSGKTLAYLVPLVQRLQGRHSSTFGIKSLILCPSRELALQILKVGKELARGWKGSSNAEEGSARDEAIRWALVVGGESMDEQFALMASNPDVVISTPGRLLHLAVEMNLDLKSVEYVVFDEADRLFEMGFEAQLEELLLRLPPTRQTLLFSATLPKTLVEFARAGLQANPKLIRLDADSKISAELRMAFLSVKPAEKEAALLLLLRDIIGVPFGEQGKNAGNKDDDWKDEDEQGDRTIRKRKFNKKHGPLTGADHLLPHQTIIFCATKHHVEYLLLLLTTAGYSCSHIYSSLDQAARSLEMTRFRDGRSSLLIVTDVAARGIDLPVLEHVVNFDFPTGPRVFVHRVGRTARAGRKGWAWSFVTNAELPYLCDLQLFLARPLVSTPHVDSAPTSSDPSTALDLHSSLVLGTLPRDTLDDDSEYITNSLTRTSSQVAVALPNLKAVVGRAQKLYERSQGKASPESYRRAKDMSRGGAEAGTWALAGSAQEQSSVHDVIRRPMVYGLKPRGRDGAEVEGAAAIDDEDAKMAAARAALMAKVNTFKPTETVFEVGAKGATPLTMLMKDRRRTLAGKAARAQDIERGKEERGQNGATAATAQQVQSADAEDDENQASENEIESVFDTGSKATKSASTSKTAKPVTRGKFRDPEFYMDYEQKDAQTEKGYSLASGGSFLEQARQATFSLAGDDSKFGQKLQAVNVSRWDMKKKKFVKGDGTGANNEKYIRTESGTRLPASFRSGRFEEWKKVQKMDLPKVGEREDERSSGHARMLASRGGRGGARGGAAAGAAGGRFRHHKMQEPKRLDPLRADYQTQLKRRKAKAEAAGADGDAGPSRGGFGGRGGGRGGRGGGRGGKKTGSSISRGHKAKNELRSASQIVKSRQTAAKRKEKNSRPGRRGR